MDLYRFYDNDDRLLYIGISLHAARRASEHKRDQPWWSDVRRMAVEHLGTDISRREAEQIEMDAIRAEQPEHNVAHNVRQSLLEASNKWSAVEPTEDQFIGLFVLTPDPDDPRLVIRQGQIMARVEVDLYIVRWHSWWHGYPTNGELVDVSSMQGWRFYWSEEDWREEATSASNRRDRLADAKDRARREAASWRKRVLARNGDS